MNENDYIRIGVGLVAEIRSIGTGKIFDILVKNGIFKSNKRGTFDTYLKRTKEGGMYAKYIYIIYLLLKETGLDINSLVSKNNREDFVYKELKSIKKTLKEIPDVIHKKNIEWDIRNKRSKKKKLSFDIAIHSLTLIDVEFLFNGRTMKEREESEKTNLIIYLSMLRSYGVDLLETNWFHYLFEYDLFNESLGVIPSPLKYKLISYYFFLVSIYYLIKGFKDKYEIINTDEIRIGTDSLRETFAAVKNIIQGDFRGKLKKVDFNDLDKKIDAININIELWLAHLLTIFEGEDTFLEKNNNNFKYWQFFIIDEYFKSNISNIKFNLKKLIDLTNSTQFILKSITDIYDYDINLCKTLKQSNIPMDVRIKVLVSTTAKSSLNCNIYTLLPCSWIYQRKEYLNYSLYPLGGILLDKRKSFLLSREFVGNTLNQDIDLDLSEFLTLQEQMGESNTSVKDSETIPKKEDGVDNFLNSNIEFDLSEAGIREPIDTKINNKEESILPDFDKKLYKSYITVKYQLYHLHKDFIPGNSTESNPYC